MSTEDHIKELESKLNALTQKVENIDAVNEVRNLQFAYGYYLDKCLYDEVVDLFSEAGEVRFLGGSYRGKAGARRLYCDRFRKSFTGGYNGPQYGFLLDHQILQEIIHVAPDGKTAKGRFRIFMQAGQHVSRPEKVPHLPKQWWEAGIYENDYIKEDGVWKIKLLNYNLFWQGDYETGWAEHKPYQLGDLSATYPENPAGPDAIVGGALPFWPETPVVPFHYNHPVTGKPWTPAS